MAIIPTQNRYPDRAGYLGLDTDRNVLVGMSDGILQDMTNSTPEGWVNVKDFGAKGDGITDDTQAIQTAFDYANLHNQTVYIPSGTYIITSTLTGPVVNIIGENMNNTILKGSQPLSGYIIDFDNNTGAYNIIKNIHLSSDLQYGGDHFSGIKISKAALVILEKIKLSNVDTGIYLNNNWGSKLTDIYATYVESGLTSYFGNGIYIDHFYIIRFESHGIFLDQALSGVLNSIICESGWTGTALQFRGSSNIIVNGLYTEGQMGTDIAFFYENLRYCKNITLNGLYLNSNASCFINAKYVKGLRINDFDIQGPVPTVPYLIETGTNPNPIYIENSLQYSRSASNNLGDRRASDTPLIPLADDNSKIIILNPTINYGDGTEADVTNIQSNTKVDNSNVLPVSLDKSLFFDPTQSFGTISTYQTWEDIANFYVQANNYYSIKVNIVLQATSLSTSGTGNIRLSNTDYATQPAEKSYNFSPTTTTNEFTFLLNVKPGINHVTLQATSNTEGETITIVPKIF